MVKRHAKIDDEESMDAFDEYQSSNEEEHSCTVMHSGMTDTANELRRALQHFKSSDKSCNPLHKMLMEGNTPAKVLIVSADCKGDLHVEHDIVSRLHLFPGAPSRLVVKSSSEPIPDDWDLVGHPGFKGFNSRIGGKGSLSYLIGFDEDFAKKAQVHITDFAKQKRERRIAYRKCNREMMKSKRRKKKSKEEIPKRRKQPPSE